jgi:hypothetical protein
MGSFLNLRDDGASALGLQEQNLCGQTMPTTAMSGCAMARARLAPGSRRIPRPRVMFRALGGAKISEILIGCAAIRNRCNSLKVKGGSHF